MCFIFLLLLKDQLDQRFSQVHMVDLHIGDHLMILWLGASLSEQPFFFYKYLNEV